MDEKPMWRQVFDAVDSEIAPRMEQFVRTEQFADAMAALSKLNERAMQTAAEFNRQMLAFWGMPSRNDVAELKKQLEAVDRELHKVTKALTEAQHGDS